ncbi:MAG TPA: UDP-N-acetylmuramate dehydrogenase [Bryobacteraceae bacterium]|nr:UDP-N-acetylmuramate dehydrogenase [Bryobacteraceae bacterium]
MPKHEQVLERLAQIPTLQIAQDAALARYTRFGLGGPADVYAETDRVEPFVEALKAVRASGVPHAVIGSGTNLVVSDDGFRGVVLRFTARTVSVANGIVSAYAGAELQDVIDCAIANGLKGIETMAGIPGSLGAAVYGNAGAYGHSISEVVRKVRFFDGDCERVISNAECEFRYRESVFKRHKQWIIFSADLALVPAPAEELRRTADDIVAVRNAKFPPTMKCAGSVFKNLLLAELPETAAARVPEKVVKEGKVPAAFFLEQAGAKGVTRGGIHVADYHANLIYNTGAGTARDLIEVITELKQRVRGQFGVELEEEVQYVGFE